MSSILASLKTDGKKEYFIQLIKLEKGKSKYIKVKSKNIKIHLE